MTKLVTLATIVLFVTSHARAGDAPTIGRVLPDRTGGVWVTAKDESGRAFLRFCAPRRDEPCTLWRAVDLDWSRRIVENDRPHDVQPELDP